MCSGGLDIDKERLCWGGLDVDKERRRTEG